MSGLFKALLILLILGLLLYVYGSRVIISVEKTTASASQPPASNSQNYLTSPTSTGVGAVWSASPSLAAESQGAVQPSKNSLVGAVATTAGTLPIQLNPSSVQVLLLLNATVNQYNYGKSLIVLQRNSQELLVRQQDLQDWNIVIPPTAQAFVYKGSTYYSLAAFPGTTFKINQQNLSVAITFPLQFFGASSLTPNRASFLVTPQKPPFGAYLNYDTLAQAIPGENTAGGVFDFNAFDDLGFLESGFLSQNTLGSNTSNNPNANTNQSLVRLNTTLEHDDPAKMTSLRLGDSFSTPGMWGNSVDFGGIQYATNFSTQPGFIYTPLPSLPGEAVMPSTVNLYVNNALVDSQKVPAGPFNIPNIPTINGQGMITVETTDLLGRQQIITVPYYASNQLLTPGLQEYGYEAGFVRNNYGIDSFDYGQAALIGTDRMGVTDNTTVEWHAEGLANQQTLGGGTFYKLGNLGILNTAVAASQQNSKPGALGQLGIQLMSFTSLSYGFNEQATTNNYTEIAYLDAQQQPPALQSQVFVGFPVFKSGSLTLAYTALNNRDGQPNSSLLNATYSQALPEEWMLSLTGLTNIGGQVVQGIMLSLTRAIGNTDSLSLGDQWQGGNTNQPFANFNRAMPQGPGYGYNLYTAQSVSNNNGLSSVYQGTVTAQNNLGTYMAGTAYQNNQMNYQTGISGSIVYMDKDVFLTRQVNNAFALVEVPGLADTPVSINNQVSGTTNSQGYIVLPEALPYQNNNITIDPSQLPLDAVINSPQVNPIPYYHSGAIAIFPIKVSHSATLTTVLPNGTVVPAGAPATLEGQNQTFPVGNDGLLYLTGLQAKNIVTIAWQGQSCTFEVDYPSTKQVQPDLGKFVCDPKPVVTSATERGKIVA